MAVEIKICGVTRPVDAERAAALGVDRLGVVFAWGPRVVSPGIAREIVVAAGGVPVLGVVSGGDAASYAALAAEIGLAGLQLHGESDPGVARVLRASGLEVWRIATLGTAERMSGAVAHAAVEADLVLLEPEVPGRPGGRGVRLDLDLARRARRLRPGQRTGLAGGLLPTSVGEAIHLVGPDLVDVSSGVESAPGIKDPRRMADFVEAVRDACTPG